MTRKWRLAADGHVMQSESSADAVRPEYIYPYLFSNLFAIVTLLLAIQSPKAARWILAAVFGMAAVANTRMAAVSPFDYLAYADLALLPIYQDFIRGPFSQHVQEIVLTIAIGQAVISLAFAIGDRLLPIGVIGAVIFLAAIAPLGVGSAFPFSIFFAAAAVVVWRRHAADRAGSSAGAKSGEDQSTESLKPTVI